MKIKINSWSVICSNLVKVITAIVIYNAILVPIIFFNNVEYTDNFSQNKSSKTIGLVGIAGFMGEDNVGVRSLHAAKNLGWRAYYFRYPMVMNAFPFLLLDSPVTVTNFVLNQIYEPEYIISVTQIAKRVPFGKKFIFFNVPFKWMKERLDFPYQDYDGYIDVNKLGKDEAVFKEFLRKKNKGLDKKILGFVVPVHKYEYRECDPKKLVVFGGLGGRGRDSKKYADFVKMLNDTGYTLFYGNPSTWKNVSESYQGYLATENDVIEAVNKGCIGLAIHSHDHIDAAIPTTRVMEIAAASSNIISDKNPFVMSNFGNNVLYFDQTLSAKEIFQQVDAHVKWLIDHPKEARVMRKKSYDIYINNYTAEKFLLEIDRYLGGRGENKNQ